MPLYIAAKNGDTEIVKLLIEAGGDLEILGPRLLTPLGIAADSGHSETVEVLLAAGANIDHHPSYRNQPGYNPTAMGCAPENGHVDICRLLIQKGANLELKTNERIVRMLLEAGADSSVVDEEGNCFALNVASSGLLDDVRILLDSDPTLSKKVFDYAPLIFALENENDELGVVLLERGADPRAVSPGDQKRVFDLAVSRNCVKTLTFLLKNGIGDINEKNKRRTPRTSTPIELLLACKADPNSRNYRGQTPLHILCSAERFDPEGNSGLLLQIARMSLEHGANPTLADSKGQLAIDVLLSNDQFRGAGIGVDFESKTPLHYAAAAFSSDLVDVLFSHPKQSPDLNALDDSGDAPIHCVPIKWSSSHEWTIDKSLSFIKHLVDYGGHGADPNLADREGGTPLHKAAANAYEGIVIDTLVGAGANIFAIDNKGRTPLRRASYGPGKTLIVAALIKAAGPRAKELSGCAGSTRTNCIVYAACITRLESVRLLVDEAKAEVEIVRLLTPLLAAARGGSFEIVSLLLVKGANILHRAEQNLTLLHLGAFGGLLDLFKLVDCASWEEGIEVKSDDGMTPALYSCRSESGTMFRVLVEEFGADKHAKDKFGRTALHIAAFYGKSDVVKQVLDIIPHALDMLDDNGSTPLLSSIRGKLEHREDTKDATEALVEAGCSVESIILLRNGADLRTVGPGNVSCLMLAMNYQIVNFHDDLKLKIGEVIQDEDLVLRKDDEGRILHYAVLVDHNGVAPIYLGGLALLIEAGAKTDIQYFTMTVNRRAFNKLLEDGTGGPVSSRDGHMKTPLHYAADHYSVETIEALIKRGADFIVEEANLRYFMLKDFKFAKISVPDALRAELIQSAKINVNFKLLSSWKNIGSTNRHLKVRNCFYVYFLSNVMWNMSVLMQARLPERDHGWKPCDSSSFSGSIDEPTSVVSFHRLLRSLLEMLGEPSPTADNAMWIQSHQTPNTGLKYRATTMDAGANTALAPSADREKVRARFPVFRNLLPIQQQLKVGQWKILEQVLLDWCNCWRLVGSICCSTREVFVWPVIAKGACAPYDDHVLRLRGRDLDGGCGASGSLLDSVEVATSLPFRFDPVAFEITVSGWK
ncbi:ankyrin repeat-containing domain protein [Cladochytrium replicatum]|nr:ankyrin repeat-containing domain protein [Cladochytrium replicatum]